MCVCVCVCVYKQIRSLTRTPTKILPGITGFMFRVYTLNGRGGVRGGGEGPPALAGTREYEESDRNR